MMTVLPPKSQSAYVLTESLREESRSLATRAAMPSEADREELVLKKLGARGWGRLYHFRQFYSQGWGDGQGRPLSPGAVESFYRFLQEIRFPEGCTPSLFLTDEGCLELCWEDDTGKSVQVEFTPHGAEFYIEGSGREGVAEPAKLSDLAQQLSN